jgi:hypothetical protein
LHDPFERGRLVFEPRDGRPADQSHEFTDRQIPVDFDPKRQDVDEEPDQPLEFRQWPSRSGGSDADVVLAGVALGEERESGQQRHEQGRVVLVREAIQFLAETVVVVLDERCAALAGIRSAEVVAWKLQGSFVSRQALAPVGKMLGDVLFALPGGKIAVLDGKLGKQGLATLREGLVALEKLGKKNPFDRPAVGHDMVDVEQKQVFAGSDAHQLVGHHRAVFQIEAVLGVAAHQSVDFGLSGLDGHEDQFLRWCGKLHGSTSGGGDESRAKVFVTLKDPCQAPCQGGKVEVSLDEKDEGDVPACVRGIHALQEPQALLQKG